MFNSLLKYKHIGVFSFSPTERLQDKCNAPKTCSGVYMVEQGEELIYIGRMEECLQMVQYAIAKVVSTTDWSMDISLRRKQGSILGH